MSDRPPSSGLFNPNLRWYQQIWLGLPLVLVPIGGAIGGACGAAAWAINQKVFQKTQHPVLRYVWTGLISVAAVFAYVALVTLLFLLFKKQP